MPITNNKTEIAVTPIRWSWYNSWFFDFAGGDFPSADQVQIRYIIRGSKFVDLSVGVEVYTRDQISATELVETTSETTPARAGIAAWAGQLLGGLAGAAVLGGLAATKKTSSARITLTDGREILVSGKALEIAGLVNLN
jgi:hypothetical protein